MPKNKKISRGNMLSVRTLVCCAMMVAVSVVLARLMSIIPDESSRFSIEAVPIFISGILFGPFAGAIVGFTSDLVGCMFSPFGYNPALCLPPVICGLCGGIFRKFIFKKTNVFRIAVAFLPYILLACILWQSFALSLFYGGDAKEAFFVAKLGTRSIQFGIIFVLDVVLVWLLYKSKLFSSLKLWPPSDLILKEE